MTSPNESDREGTSSNSSHEEEQHSTSSSSSSDSSSNSTDATSASNSPPQQDAQPVAIATDTNQSLGPRSNHDASYSATPPRRSKKHTSARNATRLGAIDEHSSIIAPDIPSRNQARRHHRYGNATKFFTFGAFPRVDHSVPPVGAYDDVTGPRGEKFGDLRQNKPFQPPNRGLWRRFLCLGLVALILLLAIGLGVGLGVGLTRNKENRSQDASVSTDGSNSTSNSEPFPLGTWKIPTYLTEADTNCTSNPSTWRCYPYSTYNSASPTSSFSTLKWLISSPTNSTLDLQITDTNPLFSYPFTDVSLQLVDTNDPRLSAFSFTFAYRKQVVPSTAITSDGAATRCYYNNTSVSVRMYNTAQGAGGNVTEGNTTALAGQSDWPYAIEYFESVTEGPQCYLYVNGEDTSPVTVDAGNGTCACGYRNYGLN